MNMRIRHRAACGSAVAAALVVATALTQGASKNFVPDVVFKGSSLSGWRPFGNAKWRADNGEIVAAPGGGSGWLILDKSVHNRSGIGSNAVVVDLNKDGAAEIIVSTRRGTFVFWNNWKKPAAISAR